MVRKCAGRAARWTALGLVALAASAWAAAPTAEQMSRIQTLVHDLNSAIGSARTEARLVVQQPAHNRYHEVAAHRLDLLANRLNAFNGTIVASISDPSRSTADFNRLLSAYFGALEFASWLHSRPAVATHLARAQLLMDELAGYYGGYPEYGSVQYRQLIEADPEVQNMTVIVVPPQTGVQATGTTGTTTVWTVQPQNERCQRILELSRSQFGRLENLAERLEDATDDAMKEARVHARDPGRLRWEELALRRLNIFEERAEDFEKAVKAAPSGDLSGTTDEYEKLLGAYFSATESFRWLFTREGVEDDFREVASLMDELAGYYGGYPEPGTEAYRNLTLHVDIDDGRPQVERAMDKEGSRE
jgi:hypothetical protein